MNITIDGVDRSAAYTPEELEAIEIAMAAESGEQGIGTAPVPTDDPTEEAYSGQQFLVEIGAVTILDGFVGPVQRDRGGVVSGTRQTLRYSVIDENALLKGHRAVKWTRPEETDRARMLAAIDEFLGYLSLDTSMVLNTNNETIPAKTYMTEELFDELQTDCGDPTAKLMFIENRRFHWHRQTEGDSAGLTIVASGADRSTTFELETRTPPTRSKDGMDLVTDVVARNPTTGVSYSTSDATAIARHDAAGVRHERLVEAEGGLTYLTTLATRLLATYKTERITYEGEIGPLTPAQVALIPPGSLITVTNPIWGLTSSVQRIAGLRLKYVHPDRFMATLQLGFAKRLRSKPLKSTQSSSAGTGADVGGSGAAPSTDCGCPPFVSSVACGGNCADTFDRTVGSGGGVSELVGHPTWGGASGCSVGSGVFTIPSGEVATLHLGAASLAQPVQVKAKIHMENGSAGGAGDDLAFTLMIFETNYATNVGVDGSLGAVLVMNPGDPNLYFDVFYHDSISAHPSPTVTVDTPIGGTFDAWVELLIEPRLSGTRSTIRGRYWRDGDVPPDWQTSINAAWTTGAVTHACSPASGFAIIHTGDQADTVLTVDTVCFDSGLACDGGQPAAGQWIGPETLGTGDDVTTDFRTTYAYAPGSIEVTVDNLPEPDFTETPPNTITLGTAPASTEVIRARYRGTA